jgi:carbamate kinase
MAQQVVFGFVPRVAVVAFGGKALLPTDTDGTQEEQQALARDAAVWLADVVAKGYELAVVHGSGPQVGNALTRAEQAALQVPPMTLDLAVAETQGSLGYLLQAALRNELARRGTAREVVTLLSEIEVDPDDAAFRHPATPVGPYVSRLRGRTLAEERGWTMKEEAGRGLRKVVPCPRPKRVVNVDTVRRLVCCGTVTIAAGGGGIPVVRRGDGDLVGVEALLDPDATASLLAAELKADLLLLVTGAPRLVEGFGTRRAREIPELRVSEAKRMLRDGEFPAGTMGPKVEAAIRFVEATGGTSVITDPASVKDALEREGGTILLPDAAPPRKAKKKAGRTRTSDRRESGK